MPILNFLGQETNVQLFSWPTKFVVRTTVKPLKYTRITASLPHIISSSKFHKPKVETSFVVISPVSIIISGGGGGGFSGKL